MKKLFICLLIIVSCFLLTGCGKEKENDKKKESKEETVEVPKESVSFSDEKVEISEGSATDKMYRVLYGYGKAIYEAKAYEKYNKKNDMYFVSLQQLKDNFAYDISSFKGDDGTVCDVADSGIYFDIDNVMNLEYKDDFIPVLPSLVKCSLAEIKSASSGSSN